MELFHSFVKMFLNIFKHREGLVNTNRLVREATHDTLSLIYERRDTRRILLVNSPLMIDRRIKYSVGEG